MQGEKLEGYFEDNKSTRMIVIGLERGIASVLTPNVLYYREHEIRGIKRPQLCVQPKDDLWDILEDAHNELSHAGRDRMHA